MSDESLERLRAIRGGNRGVVTKLVNEAEEILIVTTPLERAQKSRISVISQQLDNKLKMLNDIDKDILGKCEVSVIPTELEESETVTSKVLSCKQKIEEALHPVATPTPISGPPSAISTTSTPQPKAKLPKLTLPRFRGDVKNWPAFWDSFQSAVHSHDDIPKVDKFNYLNSLLEGPAFKTIQGFTLNGDNYDSAIKMLQERFGDPQQIISAHMEGLIKIPNCTCDKLSSLRSLYDRIMVHIRGLEALKVSPDQYGSLLIPLIMAKLPDDIRLRIARGAGKGPWKIGPLLDILKEEVEAREASEGATVSTGKSSTPHNRHPSNPTASSLVASSFKVRCVYCNGEHFSASCTTVVTAASRKEILLKSGRCFNCLKTRHKLKDCDSLKSCRYCHKRHHQSICEHSTSPHKSVVQPDSSSIQGLTNNTDATSGTTSSALSKPASGKRVVLLQTARAVAMGENSQTEIRILLDSGSQLSYVTKTLQTKLQLKPIKREKLRLNTFGSSSFDARPCDVVSVRIRRPCSDEEICITAYTSSVICSPLPTLVNAERYHHLEGLELADNNCESSDCSIDLLIGSDYYWTVVTGETISNARGPVAISSKLGWLVSGPLCGLTELATVHCNTIVANSCELTCDEKDALVTMLRQFWDTEAIGVSTDCMDDSSTQTFIERLRFSQHRYEVGLPWKEGHCNIPDHFTVCLNRLRLLHSRLLRNPELLAEYNAILQEQLQQGIIEMIPESQGRSPETTVHYLPHHCVVRQDKQTTKLRIVYDGSAKTRTNPVSLNDCLKTGPNFIPKLFDVLIRFRWHLVALTADIERAFLMISISPEDRDALRFLWLKNPNDVASDILELRFTRLVFGLRPSPAILGSVISHHLDKYQPEYGHLASEIKNSFYVDDLISGGATIDQAFRLYTVARQTMAQAGFNLRKWHSNSEKLLRVIQAESKEVNHTGPIPQVSSKFIVMDNTSHSKLLGIVWDSNLDTFTFSLSELIELVIKLPASRRSLLRVTASIFDPLGVLSPFVIRLKMLFQLMCSEGREWDQPLEGQYLRHWETLVEELKILNEVKIPRCYFKKESSQSFSEVHGFSDASENAYAAALYLRTVYEDGTVSVCLVASKTRVSPVKKQTIPRLELLGALILTRLADTVMQQFPLKLPITYWVDSTTTLCWIKNHRPWKQYVSRRVNEIRSMSVGSQWRYCPGEVNPADFPSRGLEAKELIDCTSWWEGPSFLKLSKDEWPTLHDPPFDDVVYSELLKPPTSETHVLAAVVRTVVPVDLDQVINCKDFCSLNRLLRVTARVLRFLEMGRGKHLTVLSVQYNGVSLNAAELDRAEILWIRSIQAQSFAGELRYLDNPSNKTKPLYVDQFGLYLDSNHILKCKGRINNSTLSFNEKNPIFLPSKHPFIKLLVMSLHCRAMHGGVDVTLTAVREKYWILRGRQMVKAIVRSCVICKKLEGPAYATQPPPDLPDFRVSDDPPFSHTGLDFAGPMYIRSGGSADNLSKVYVCLFTCASTRAVHLELTCSLNVDSFLLAFRRFVGRRGLPVTLISDNAKTFRCSSKEVQLICRSSAVQRYLTNQRIMWKFSVAKAPWWGGFWERMVQTVKRSLRKVIGRATLQVDELNTLLIEVEAIVNSRPLTFVYDDTEGVSYPLTPSHLINGRRLASSPSASHFEVVSTNITLTRRAKKQRHLLDQFLKHWKKSYLLNLREHRQVKLKKTGPTISVGDVVIVRDDNAKRLFWKLARVVELLPGPDRITRAALINVSCESGPPKILKRSISHLIPIEVDVCNNETTEVSVPDIESRDEAQGQVEPETSVRPRRNAAVLGEATRRAWTNHL